MTGQQTGYTLQTELGSGAVASVWRVVDEAGRSYAAKILHASREHDPAAAERFAREAEVVTDIEHPNLVKVYGMRTIDGTDALLMELVEGPTLSQVIAHDAPLAPERLIGLGLGIARGLAAAHARGVIHRDLKPANILVARAATHAPEHSTVAHEVAKIGDFGMARASSWIGTDPQAFAVLGTPDYMAPESLEPLSVDARSDLYALGCMLHEMASGRPPYGGATAFAVLDRHRTAPIPAFPPAYPRALATVVGRLLAKDPGERPQSAGTVVGELQAMLESADPSSALAIPNAARCVRCGAPVHEALAVCLQCGLALPRMEAGEFTVFVVGPGEVAEKLESTYRERLLTWMRNTPSLGLDESGLSRRIPRLPFVVVSKVSEACANSISNSLAEIGLGVEVMRGGGFSLPQMRAKSLKLAGRVLAILAASSGYLFAQAAALSVLGGFAFLVVAVTAGVTIFGAQPIASVKRRRVSALPPGIEDRLRNIARVGPELRAARHREALRGVVGQALALHAASTSDIEVQNELQESLDLALVAAGRLDELDLALEGADLRDSNAEVHALMRERDTWSSRLLDLGAVLETLRTRIARANAGRGAVDADAMLLDLRARIDALEEVQSV